MYKPEEIDDAELARSNTIQKTVSSFTRSFTLTGSKKKDKAAEAEKAAEAAAPAEEEDDDDDDEEEEDAFTWVYVALMSDHTLRQVIMLPHTATHNPGPLCPAPSRHDAHRCPTTRCASSRTSR